MAEQARKRMTSDEFLAWAMEQPETSHYELVDGEVVAMAPEQIAHTRTKAFVWRRLTEGIEAGKLLCEALADGATVEVDAHTVYEPDALVRCGPRLPGTAVKLTDPVIVVEVRTRSTGGRDAGIKLVDYFRVPSVRHYLIVRTEDRTIIHHQRGENGIILTRVVRDGPIQLDPPGLALTDCFPPGTD